MIVFVISSDPEVAGRLVFTDEPWKEVPARSGPWGKGPLPPGRYMLGKPTTLDTGSGLNAPYTDPSGFAWWIPITPQFSTDRKSLGVHPDGNIPGTLGCIGVAGKNTKPVLARLREGDVLIVV